MEKEAEEGSRKRVCRVKDTAKLTVCRRCFDFRRLPSVTPYLLCHDSLLFPPFAFNVRKQRVRVGDSGKDTHAYLLKLIFN